MTLTGKLDSYLAMKKDGLNTIELDLKDESGNVTFTKGAPAIAKQDGAALRYFDPNEVVGKVHKAGMYLIGRVVTFEDPITVQGAPGARDPHAATARSGARTAASAGSIPYSTAAWKYDVDVARCRGEGRLRRDPVRLRPLPERRRRLDHPLPGQARPADERDGGGLPPLCRHAPAPARRPRLGRRLRPLGDARPRHRPASRPDRRGGRRDLSDDVSLPLHRGRVQPARPERGAGPDRLALPDATSRRSSAAAAR